mmetsp:Transcript_25777/g.38550  ORF Transcript_25777/g.38550 Transcript_25777/m.38550 type:complete len:143 (-) Transcript_25777:18-446(-)
MKKILSTILIALTLFVSSSFYSCQSNTDDCAEIACTLIFLVEYVTITDQNQNPVALDSFQVINLETNEDITLELTPEEFQFGQQMGTYPLVNDLSVSVGETINIQFKGFINSIEVITENYTVVGGCCHVGVSEGNLEIVLSN